MPDSNEERRRGYWEGKADGRLSAIEKTLESLDQKVDKLFLERALHHGLMAGIGLFCGAMGTIVSTLGPKLFDFFRKVLT